MARSMWNTTILAPKATFELWLKSTNGRIDMVLIKHIFGNFLPSVGITMKKNGKEKNWVAKTRKNRKKLNGKNLFQYGNNLFKKV